MEMQWDLVSCWGIGSHECENRLYKSFCFCTWNWFDFRCLFSWFFGTGGTPSSTCSLLPLLKSSIVISTKRSTGLQLGQDLRVLPPGYCCSTCPCASCCQSPLYWSSPHTPCSTTASCSWTHEGPPGYPLHLVCYWRVSSISYLK